MKKIKVDPKRLGVIIGIAVAIIIIIAIAVSGNKDKKKVEGDENPVGSVVETKKLTEAKEYNGLEISNVKFTIGENLTELKAEVTNSSDSDKPSQYVNFNVLDKDGNKLTSVGGKIDAIGAGETKKISTRFPTIGTESNFYDVEITEKRTEEPQENVEDTNNN